MITSTMGCGRGWLVDVIIVCVVITFNITVVSALIYRG